MIILALVIRLEEEKDWRKVEEYYYPRFGFKESKAFGITTRDGKNFPAFMAIELIEGALSGITGCFHESPAYSVDPIKACKYDHIFE